MVMLDRCLKRHWFIKIYDCHLSHLIGKRCENFHFYNGLFRSWQRVSKRSKCEYQRCIHRLEPVPCVWRVDPMRSTVCCVCVCLCIGNGSWGSVGRLHKQKHYIEDRPERHDPQWHWIRLSLGRFGMWIAYERVCLSPIDCMYRGGHMV